MNDRGVAENLNIFIDEIHRRSNLHSIRAPSEFPHRCRITTADEIDPEGLFYVGNQLDYLYRKVSISHVCLEIVNESMDVVDDRGSLNQGVHASDENPFPFADWRW
tara:strand:+ start:124 stop:441 length:318 start_codon:yes stop_codon:yes gene_type:complete